MQESVSSLPAQPLALDAVRVVLVNYNSGSALREALTALRRHYPDVAVSVVDNASTDDSLAGVESFHVTLIRNERNRGFAAACNQGAFDEASWLLFLNPDACLHPGSLEALSTALLAGSSIGLAGGLLLNPDGSEQRGCRRALPDPAKALLELSGLTRLFPRRFSSFNHVGTPLPEDVCDVGAVSGAMLMLSHALFEQLGGWDEGYFLHGEDLDLCARTHALGYRVVFVPQARATHAQGSCSKARPYFVSYHKHRGMSRYHERFLAGRYLPPFNWLVQFGIWSHFVLDIGKKAIKRP